MFKIKLSFQNENRQDIIPNFLLVIFNLITPQGATDVQNTKFSKDDVDRMANLVLLRRSQS